MKRASLTLIELLIVIAVIAMLIGIVLPVLHIARQQARAVACGLNLKQLSLALTTYCQENETFPHGFDDSPGSLVEPPGDYIGDSTYDKMGWWWFHFLANILGKD
ncbi:unnamed protein product, partial [marine sediment metagenome]